MTVAAEPVPNATVIKSLQEKQMGFMLTSVNKTTKEGEYRGKCVFMLLPESGDLIETELGVIISELKVSDEHASRLVIGNEQTDISVTPEKLPPLALLFDSAERGTLSITKKGVTRKTGNVEFAKK